MLGFQTPPPPPPGERIEDDIRFATSCGVRQDKEGSGTTVGNPRRSRLWGDQGVETYLDPPIRS